MESNYTMAAEGFYYIVKNKSIRNSQKQLVMSVFNWSGDTLFSFGLGYRTLIIGHR